MKILIAGASGVIGRPLTRALLAQGHEVVALTRSDARAADLLALGAQPVVADVLDEAALTERVGALQVDAIVNQLTDLKKPPMTHARMAGTNRLRRTGTDNLVRLARRLGASRFVTQSMVFGYGYGTSDSRLLTENDEFAPAGAGRFEEHLAAMRSNESAVLPNESFAGIALRYGLFYGIGTGEEDLVQALRRRMLPAVRDAGPLSWIYLDDAVTATVAALEHGRAGQAYNVVDDEPVSWTDMMTALARAVGAPAPLRLPAWALAALPYARRMMLGGVRVSNSRAKAELGWAPAVPTYREGVARIAAHHRGPHQTGGAEDR